MNLIDEEKERKRNGEIEYSFYYYYSFVFVIFFVKKKKIERNLIYNNNNIVKSIFFCFVVLSLVCLLEFSELKFFKYI